MSGSKTGGMVLPPSCYSTSINLIALTTSLSQRPGSHQLCLYHSSRYSALLFNSFKTFFYNLSKKGANDTSPYRETLYMLYETVISNSLLNEMAETANFRESLGKREGDFNDEYCFF